MARTSKTKTSDASVVSTPAPVVDKVEKSSKTASKAPKEPKAPKAKKADAAPAEPVVAVVAQESVDASAETDALLSSFTKLSEEFVSKIQQTGSMLASMKKDFGVLQKQFSRELKTAQKQGGKRKRKAGTRAPSGFVKPTRISDELASFLDKPLGSEMARTDVTRDINTYIRSHDLQDKVNGRKINPDSKLAALLKIGSSDELTYFNLQKFMSPHFAKSVKAEAVATA
jgi:upstream activation factor subunit UAF30